MTNKQMVLPSPALLVDLLQWLLKGGGGKTQIINNLLGCL